MARIKLHEWNISMKFPDSKFYFYINFYSRWVLAESISRGLHLKTITSQVGEKAKILINRRVAGSFRIIQPRPLRQNLKCDEHESDRQSKNRFDEKRKQFHFCSHSARVVKNCLLHLTCLPLVLAFFVWVRKNVEIFLRKSFLQAERNFCERERCWRLNVREKNSGYMKHVSSMIPTS